MRLSKVLLMLGLFLAAGCAPGVRRYEWSTDEAALAELAHRAELVKTVEASCSIVMRDESGRHVTLDGALVARNPSHLRIRAWKLHHPAFDLTATPQGIFLEASSSDEKLDRVALGTNITKAWSTFTGGFLLRPLVIDETRSTAGTIVLRESKSEKVQVVMHCMVDRRTLTPRAYEATGSDGKILYAIRLERYRQVGEIIWPRRITFESGERIISISVDEVEFNSEPTEHAFTPPRGAERLP